jgi:hypothetical protein
LFEKEAQLWTKLEEDQQVQQWDQEEERISAAIQDLKQRQKTMSIMEHVKGAQDMKKLQAELITTPGSNGTAPGVSSRGHCTGRGSQDIYGTDPGRMCKVDQRQDCSTDIGRTQGEDHAGSNTSNRAQGEVPSDHQGDR